MPFTSDDIVRLTGATVWDVDGEKIGRIGQVYTDADGVPSWATIRTGFLGTTESFFPLSRATFEGRDVRVPFSEELMHHAPRIDAAEELAASDADELHDYYARSGNVEALREPLETVPGDTTDTGFMTRSEERLAVGVRRVERGRVRLRKSVVTEQQTVMVTVRHEEATLVRESLTDAGLDVPPAPRELSEEEHVIILHSDVVVTEKDIVPVERIRLGTQQVTEEQDITAEVQQEQIELIDEDGAAR